MTTLDKNPCHRCAAPTDRAIELRALRDDAPGFPGSKSGDAIGEAWMCDGCFEKLSARASSGEFTELREKMLAEGATEAEANATLLLLLAGGESEQHRERMAVRGAAGRIIATINTEDPAGSLTAILMATVSLLVSSGLSLGTYVDELQKSYLSAHKRVSDAAETALGGGAQA